MTEATRPGGTGRVVRAFDFEEMETNPGKVPRYWYRAQEEREGAGKVEGKVDGARKGYPYWNQAEIVYTGEGGVAATGRGSIRLPTAGGSTSLMLESGVIPIFRQADYFVSGSVLPEGLSFAGGCIAARFLDASGKPIAGTDRRSEVVRGRKREGQDDLADSNGWREIGVVLVGDREDAAYIQIELLLLQPEQAAPETGGQRAVWRQDVSGSVWFDDVTVVQLPRVELSMRAPANMAMSETPPELVMSVRDLTGEALRVEVRVFDPWGHECDRIDRVLGGGGTEHTWKPALARFGWYRAVMDIVGENGRVGGAYTDFVWLPPKATAEESISRNITANTTRYSGRSRDASKFGINVGELQPAVLTRLPGVLRITGTGRVTIPAWDATLTPETLVARSEAFVPMVDTLLTDWQDVTISLGRVPDRLAAEVRVPTDDPLTLLLTDDTRWLPYVGDLLDRYGQRVRRWQLGRVGDDRAFWRASLRDEAATLHEQLSRHVAGPLIDLPSRLDRAWSAGRLSELADTVSMTVHVPAEISAAGVREAAERWVSKGDSGTAGRPELTLVFETPDQMQYGMAAAPSEVVKRAVEVWAATADAGGAPVTLELNQPWTVVGERRPQMMPRPELAAWATVIRMLEGRRVVGTYPISEGIVCYILGPIAGESDERGGALVAWNEACLTERAELYGFLGDGALSVVDIYGNRTPLKSEPSTVPGRRAAVRLPIGDEPVFIEGIDVELTRFISGLEVQPAFLESTNQQHERTIRIVNPWATAISGRLTILEPGGFNTATGQRDRNWKVSPRTMRFTADPRQTIELPFTIAFSPTEEQGPKQFVADVELTAEQSYGIVTIHRSLEVGLDNVVMDMAYAMRGNGAEQDVVIEAAVTNTGEQPLTLELTCFAPGLPRLKGVVSELPAGHQVVKRFTFPAASGVLRGKKIVISATDPDGTSRLNKSLFVQ